MIQKLKKRFVFINMCLVSLVLLLVFTAICASNYQRLTENSRNMLQFLLSDRRAEEKPALGKNPDRKAFITTPGFAVTLDEGGSTKLISGDEVAIPEADLLEAVTTVQERQETDGYLWNLNLRYMVRNGETGTRISFVDISEDIKMMKSIVYTSVRIFLLAIAAFFGISCFLAKLALRPVEKAWAQQRRFVADASHELRTPLTVILANMEILLKHKGDRVADQEKWIVNTQEEGLRMKRLVEDLLFLACADDGRMQLALKKQNISALVAATLLQFESLAFEKGMGLASDIMPNLCMDGDEDRIKQLLIILLDNAMSYAEVGSEIFVSLKEENGVVLRVHNIGSFIPPQDLENVFDRFYRADFARSRSSGGAGLGLSIAKSIALSHKASISAQSDRDSGTTFVVVFPKEKSL